MQDNDSIDDLVSEILKGKGSVNYGNVDDIDNILSGLNTDAELNTAKTDNKASVQNELPNKRAPAAIAAHDKPKPPQKMRDKLLNVAAAAGWGDDDYEDSYERELIEQAPAIIPPATGNATAQATAADKTQDTAALAPPADDAIAKEEPTVELPTMEIPTLEFSKEEIAAKRKAKAASFVLRPADEAPAPKPAAPQLVNEVDDAFREFFGETVAVDREELERGLKGKKAGKVLHNLFGARSAETGSFDEPRNSADIPEESDDLSPDEYNSPADAETVCATLKTMRSTATLKIIATGLTSLLLLYLGLSARTGLLPAIAAFDPVTKPLLFLLANFVLLLVTMLVAVGTVTGGIVGLFKEPSADSLPAIASLGALLQSLALLLNASAFSAEKTTLFTPIAAMLLFANAIGKRAQCSIVYRNFDIVSVGHDHSAAYLVHSRDTVKRVCAGLGCGGEAELLVSRPTALVKGFLRQSFSSSHSEHTAKIMSYILLCSALVGAIVSYSSTANISMAFTAFAAVLCFASPIACSLLYTIPCSLMQRSAARVGAVVPGWSSIEALGSADAVTVGARDLFPPSTVRLHGIKTFEKERIDLAILYAASVLIEGCDTLRDIFLGVIENKTDMLYKVESLTQETGYGFTAWIEHSRVILGSRDMMLRHDIDIPSLDYELKYTKDERSPIYLAVAGKLFGMFLVSYCADDDAYDVVQSLRHSGVSLVVRSDDFNITSELIAEVYGLPIQSVKVLTGDDRDALAPNVAYLPESEGIMTHIGTFSSFIGGLRAAEGAAGGVKMGSIVQCAAIIFGIIICILLCFTGGILSLSLTAVILYQIAWGALTILMPFLKRY